MHANRQFNEDSPLLIVVLHTSKTTQPLRGSVNGPTIKTPKLGPKSTDLEKGMSQNKALALARSSDMTKSIRYHSDT